jgi:hypothetical protein
MSQFRFSVLLSNIANIFGRSSKIKENTQILSGISALPRPEGFTANVADTGRIKFGAGLRHASR